jgi:fatty acid desaturase/cytochrome b involved in lipid metabolism
MAIFFNSKSLFFLPLLFISSLSMPSGSPLSSNFQSSSSSDSSSARLPLVDNSALAACIEEEEQRKKKKREGVTMEEVRKHNTQMDLWVAIHGKAYDITSLVPRHPGGKLPLLQFAGKDATDAFEAFHPLNVIEGSWLKSYYKADIIDASPVPPVVQDFRKLRTELLAERVFETHPSAYWVEMARVSVLLSVAVGLVFFTQSFWLHMVSAVMLGLYFQQVAFIGHDLGHNSVTKARKHNWWIGLLMGNLVTGISIGWWKKSHNVHHVCCNSVENDPDIQHLPFLAVSDKIFGKWRSTFHNREMLLTSASFSRWLVCFQHWLYYPLMGIARFNLYAQSLILMLSDEKVENRIAELLSEIVFISGLVYFVSFLPTGREIYWYLVVSHFVAGLLHVQICLSHFSMEIYKPSVDLNWVDLQCSTTLDIDCPTWLDWLHGGLQFQIEHHLFPRIPRYRLRQIKPRVQALCAKYKLPYHEPGFVQANLELLQTLRKIADKAWNLKAGDSQIPDFRTTCVWDGLHARG